MQCRLNENKNKSERLRKVSFYFRTVTVEVTAPIARSVNERMHSVNATVYPFQESQKPISVLGSFPNNPAKLQSTPFYVSEVVRLADKHRREA